MKKEFIATATLEDRRQINHIGDLSDCARWCENVLLGNPGSIEISVKEIKQKAGEKT